MFDWDGVIIDSLEASYRVYNKIFAHMGTRQLTKGEFLELQSPNWYEFYQSVGVPQKLWKEADAEWAKLYEIERPRLHRDAVGCLKTLRGAGLKIALVSNGSRARVEEELSKFQLRSYFDSTTFGAKKEELKPSPFMLQRTLRTLKMLPADSVYVGDSPADVQAAKNAGVPSIALARGPIQEERLRAERPDYIFGGLDQVAGFLVDEHRT